MFPTLIQIGPITLSILGLMTALGFFLSSFMIWKKEKEEHFDEEIIMDGILISAFMSFIGARTGYILINWNEIGNSWLSWFDFVGKPGFVWWGALIAGSATLWFYCQKHKLDFYKVADFATFGLVIFILFILVGQFFDGSGFGAITSLPWGLKFPGLDGYRHPLQIYEFILMLILMRLLYFFDKNYRSFKWYFNKRGESMPGFLFLVFIIILGFSKLLVAFFTDRSLYWSLLQIINAAIVLIGFVLLYLKTEKNPIDLINRFGEIFSQRKRAKQPFHYKQGVDAK